MPRHLTTGELARELSVSPSAIRSWWQAGKISPALVTMGGHARWDLDAVREEIAREQLGEDG